MQTTLCHIFLDNARTTFSNLEKYQNEIQLWMNSNKVKLNPSKAEFMVFGAMQERLEPLLPTHKLRVKFETAEVVWNVDVTLNC